jgi:hypothetical protein
MKKLSERNQIFTFAFSLRNKHPVYNVEATYGINSVISQNE